MENGKNTSKGLIISTQQKKILSKPQQAFNRLIKRIERLRLDLIRLQILLDEKLGFYVENVYPLEKKLSESNKEAVKILYGFYKSKKFLSTKQLQGLEMLIANLLDDIFLIEGGEPEEDLKEIFKAVQGISYETAVEEDFEDMKENMEAMFDEFGFEMNLDGIHSKMTREEIMQKAVEMEEQFKQQANKIEQKQAAGKKTKKQQEKEDKAQQMEEARAKNISSIYKQLAKILHPDLEQNEDMKLQKEELMKQLTSAYENNDLHTLLNLELTWIQHEENNPGKLSDDKLDIYNQVLKEQINELENELAEISEHPRYQPLQRFALFPGAVQMVDVRHEKRLAEMKYEIMNLRIAKLKGNDKQSLATVKKMILDYEKERQVDIGFSPFWDNDDF